MLEEEKQAGRSGRRPSRLEQLLTIPRAHGLFLTAFAVLALVSLALRPWDRAGAALALGCVSTLLAAIVAVDRGSRGPYLLALVLGGATAVGALQAIDVGRLRLVALLFLEASVLVYSGGLALLLVAGTGLLSPLKTMLPIMAVGTALIGAESVIRVKRRLQRPPAVAQASKQAGDHEPAKLRPTRHALAWSKSIAERHPTLLFVNRPDAAIQTLYPDNPRGYFDESRICNDPDFRMVLLELHGKARAQWKPPLERLGIGRLEIQALPVAKTENVQLIWSDIRAQKGSKYTISFRARSDEPRSIGLVLSQDHPPWESTTEYQKLSLTPQWKPFRVEMTAVKTDEKARLVLSAGDSKSSVEISDFRFQGPELAAPAANLLDARPWLIHNHPGYEGSIQNFDGGVKVAVHKGAPDSPWQVQVFKEGVSLQAGKSYMLGFEGRADKARQVNLSVSQAGPPWGGCGLVTRTLLTEQPRQFRFVFEADKDAPQARILLDVAGDAAPFEVRHVFLRPYDPQGPGAVQYSMTYLTNSQGFRDRERTVERPQDVYRIACIGDSFTFAQGVRLEEGFVARLEKLLEGRKTPDARRYEVLNFSLCGYATEQERKLYEEVVWKYDPQLVLLVMVENDDETYLQEQERLKQEKARRSGTLFETLQMARDVTAGREADFGVCIREAVMLKEACAKRHSRFAAVVFRCHDNPQWRRLAETAKREFSAKSIPCLDLFDALAAGRQMPDLWVHPTADLHPNELAHRIAAEQIEKFLTREKLLQ